MLDLYYLAVADVDRIADVRIARDEGADMTLFSDLPKPEGAAHLTEARAELQHATVELLITADPNGSVFLFWHLRSVARRCSENSPMAVSPSRSGQQVSDPTDKHGH